MPGYNDAKREWESAKEMQRQNAERIRRQKMNADGTLKGFDEGYKTGSWKRKFLNQSLFVRRVIDMSLGQNKATLIKTKIEAGMATEADKKWLKKWNKKKLKIK